MKPKDDIRIIRPEGLPSMELLTGKIRRHAFRPHTHEEYAIGVVLAGVQKFQDPSGSYAAPAGTLFTLNPGDVHAGEPATELGYRYLMAYLPQELVLQSLETEAGTAPNHPHMKTRLTQDPELARRLHDLLSALNDTGTCGVQAETQLVMILRTLFQRHGELSDGEPAAAGAASILRVQQMIRERAHEPLTLSDMAETAGLSRYHFIRVFRQITGISPHAYLTQTRVFLAKAAIESGLPLAEAAVACGFSDQSHMSRYFKAIYGIPPGKFMKR